MKRVTGRVNQIPIEIRENEEMNALIAATLPPNYNFEIHKTIFRIQQEQCDVVGLQFPEGLLIFACPIVDIIKKYSWAKECIILSDVVYGACCVDDLTARKLGVGLLIHYGHSCLVPINETVIPMLYVFVDIGINIDTFIQNVVLNFTDKTQTIALMCVIQFANSIAKARQLLTEQGYNVTIPMERPRVPGEVLGCTSPKISEELCIFIADGRFHIESAMIQNPQTTFYRYDPFQTKLFQESYDHSELHSRRQEAIEQAKTADRIGVIFGTLGRQGNTKILQRIENLLQGRKYQVFLMPEISEEKLSQYQDIEAWIQISCPRLSTDWGTGFTKPLLNSHEAFMAFGQVDFGFPQDYYANSGGAWSNYYK